MGKSQALAPKMHVFGLGIWPYKSVKNSHTETSQPWVKKKSVTSNVTSAAPRGLLRRLLYLSLHKLHETRIISSIFHVGGRKP